MLSVPIRPYKRPTPARKMPDESRLSATYFTAPSSWARSPPRHSSTNDDSSMTSNQTNMLKMSPVRKAPETAQSTPWKSAWNP